MKRTTVILCALMLLGIACYAWARTTVVVVGQGAAGGTCTEIQSFGASYNDYWIQGKSGAQYIAGQFTTDTSAGWSSVTKMQIRIYSVTGNVSGKTYTLQLYTNNANNPDSKVANGSCTFSGSILTGAGYFGCVLSPAVSLSTSTTYFFGLNNAGASDEDNYVRFSTQTGSTEDVVKDADETGAWTLVDGGSYTTSKFFTGAACSGN